MQNSDDNINDLKSILNDLKKHELNEADLKLTFNEFQFDFSINDSAAKNFFIQECTLDSISTLQNNLEKITEIEKKFNNLKNMYEKEKIALINENLKELNKRKLIISTSKIPFSSKSIYRLEKNFFNKIETDLTLLQVERFKTLFKFIAENANTKSNLLSPSIDSTT
ncbi:hypothetical protein HK099_000956 [Clydaea vesicula]|uniref:Uncharacterized protein n=1 Tax=Clydaea vesicula TaxID=447962 RepID=A0AAD5TUU9_9FUNG|nr:hypothetical protein HK099_000956 [Clydaea vesicula]